MPRARTRRVNGRATDAEAQAVGCNFLGAEGGAQQPELLSLLPLPPRPCGAHSASGFLPGMLQLTLHLLCPQPAPAAGPGPQAC